jgi:WD40 repeat protein
MCSWVTLMSVVVMKQVPEVDTAVRSLTVMWDGSLVVAANNNGTCYVWRLLRGTQMITNFEPLHKLQAHNKYILKCLLSPEYCEPTKYLATTSSDHTVKIWNVDGFREERTLTGNVSVLCSCAVCLSFSLWLLELENTISKAIGNVHPCLEDSNEPL